MSQKSCEYRERRNAARARRAELPGTRAVVIDADAMPSVDVTATRMLADLAVDLRRDRVTLVIAHDIGQVRDLLRRSKGEGIDMYPSLRDAVAAVGTGGDDSARSPSSTGTASG